MLEKLVNFQSSRPCAHEEKKKPQPAGYLPPAQKRPPSRPSLLFPAALTETHYWLNTPSHNTVHHTGIGGPKVR